MTLSTTIKKVFVSLSISIAFGLIPLSASAHPYPGACPHHHWHHWHHWHHSSNADAALGILAVGAVAGIIIGAAASASNHSQCWTQIHHHKRYRYCER